MFFMYYLSVNQPKYRELSAQAFKKLLKQKKVTAYEISKQTGIDKTYLSKLAGGKIKRPGQDKLAAIASVLQIEPQQLKKVFSDPETALIELDLKIETQKVVSPGKDFSLHQDWGNAPDGLFCHFREQEIATLKNFVLESRDRVVTIYGLNGIGKTTIAVKLAQQIQLEFDYLFWRSLDPSTTLELFFAEFLELLGIENGSDLSYREQTKLFFQNLRTFRCLLIFDNFEYLLATDKLDEQHQNYPYDWFLNQINQLQHQSCILLVSSEKPKTLAITECSSTAVHSMQIRGSEAIAREILIDKQLPEENCWDSLIEAYRGHPLAIKIVATTIKEVFQGSVSEFLRQNTLFLGDLFYTIDNEYKRLSAKEQEIIISIAANNNPISPLQLKQQFKGKMTNSELMLHLDTLIRKSLIKVYQTSAQSLYSLHPAIAKYISNQR